MHGLALLSPYYKSSTCVCSVIFSLQRRCMGVLCCYFRPKMFSPGDHVRYHSRTLGAHVLASVEGTTVCLEIPLQSPPPHPGDRRALTREFARGGQGTYGSGAPQPRRGHIVCVEHLAQSNSWLKVSLAGTFSLSEPTIDPPLFQYIPGATLRNSSDSSRPSVCTPLFSSAYSHCAPCTLGSLRAWQSSTASPGFRLSQSSHYVSDPLPQSCVGSSWHWTALNLDPEGLS